MSKLLPSNLHQYFWDIDLEKLKVQEKPLFMIQRLLDKGDQKAASWVLSNFDEETIKKAFTDLRDFNPRIGNFWRLFLKIPKNQIACLQKPYQERRRTHWPY